MSGYPLQKPSDYQAFRKAYLENLNQEIENNDIIYNAVKQHKETGSLSVPSQMQDTRSPEEKMRDIIGIKTSIVKALTPISSSSFAQSFINEVEKSPLNATNTLLIFIGQRIDEVVEQLQKSYALGIKGDVNDAIQMVKFYEDMYKRQKQGILTTKSFFNRPVEQLGPQDYGQNLEAIQQAFNRDVIQGFMALSQQRQIPQDLQNILQQISTGIQGMKDFIHSDLTEIKKFIETDLKNLSPPVISSITNQLYPAYVDVLELYSKLPELSTLQQVMSNIRKYLRTNEIDAVRQSLKLLQEKFPINNEVMPLTTRLISLYDQIKRLVTTEQQNTQGDIVPVNPDTQQTIDNIQSEINQEMNYEDPLLQAQDSSIEEIIYNLSRDELKILSNYIIGYINYIPSDILVKINKDNLDSLYNFYQDTVAGQTVSDNTLVQILELLSDYDQYTKGDLNRRGYNEIQGLGLNNSLHSSFIPNLTGGSGFKQGERPSRDTLLDNYQVRTSRGRPKGRTPIIQKIAYGQGITPNPKYYPFGRYLIDSNNLAQDVISIKNMKGGSLKGFQNKKVSRHMASLVRKIIGGQILSSSDTDSLTQDEREYLHSVAKKSNILDKFDIPAPTKDSKEKELHSFEVMKGEIMAGNDNKEFIKRFKVLLSKLQRDGDLPRKEVEEILGDLSELGY